jgi:hypothetical protein
MRRPDRPLHADAPAEPDVVDAALGDEAADEPVAGLPAISDLAGSSAPGKGRPAAPVATT